jgi:nucleotide sugar dehydrogenase
LHDAISGIRFNAKKGSLIIVESTVSPGTTRALYYQIVEHNERLLPEDIDIAFSPERIDPLNKKWKITNTPKLVSGLTLNSKHRALDFYTKFVNTLVECDSLEIAETAKLLENSFRFINISFINELAMICQRLNIDIHQVIGAASSKPYGFMAFYPSMGIGGHCIPVDPIYLADKATEVGTPSEFIAVAEEINNSIPYNYVKLAEEKLGDLQDKKIIVLGVSYKPNVSDTREAPAQKLIFGLRKKGAKVFWNDELVSEWNGEKSVQIGDHFDLAVLTIHHDYMDLTKLGNVPILSTKGIS